MGSQAILRFCRISPRKARVVADAIRGLPVAEADNKLRFMPQRAAHIVRKLLKSAKANTLDTTDFDENTLYICEIKVDDGPRYRRWRPRARGRADMFLRRTCHITINLMGDLKSRR